MTRASLLCFCAVPLCLMTALSFAQQQKTVDYYQSISRQDIHKLWMTDSLSDGNGGKVPMPGILGFTGDSYQRFYIHFTSSTKNEASPYSYLVAGKTMSGKDICSFVGEIKVTQACLYKDDNNPGMPVGTAICTCTLREQCGTGKSIISGKLQTFFCIRKGHAVYNDLLSGADGYSNNQFTGARRRADGHSEKCNWGDFRIPNAQDLDQGAGEFFPSDKYLDNGWRSYKEMFTGDSATQTKAILEEHRLWWK